MLKLAAIKQLSSLQTILKQIKEDDYKTHLDILKGASIGKHVRHIIEFYECLLFNCFDGKVNYDERKRTLLLETNVKYAYDFLSEIIDHLLTIENNKRIVLIGNYEGENISMETSLYREITYNIEHTVHHLAIIGISISASFEYINLDDNFGYADSTIQYLKSQQIFTA